MMEFHNIDTVMHFAAQSHVDASFGVCADVREGKRQAGERGRRAEGADGREGGGRERRACICAECVAPECAQSDI